MKMQKHVSSTIILAFSEDGNSCADLSSHISLEFMKLDLQCRVIPLKTLMETSADETEESVLPSEPNFDILCELTAIGKLKPSQDGCMLSTLIFVLNGHSRSDDVRDIADTLREWAEDFRINRNILCGLNCSFVLCKDGSTTVSKEVIDSLLVIKESLRALGAHIPLDETFQLSSCDVGQMVTFTNMVKESVDDIELSPQMESGSGAKNMPTDTKGGRNKERNCVSRRQRTKATDDNTDVKGDLEAAELSHDSEEAEVTPVDYTSTSEYESGDEAANGGCCDTEEDLENLGNSRKMVSETQRKALTKQGYRLVGDHSAIKLCRWTKSRVRGRGGCYKHTFYGIRSNQCMEMTPSLACANKCVFCWRHHTNPVATKWKWPMDEPEFIAEESVKAHLKLIKELRGILDARSERFTEALQVRHCALSLVGEPIMYPQINELLHELHARTISTFLVTNAQFPKQMEVLRQVTQLYVSIDAADKDSLKTIDRPLFRDYWARFKRCIKLLKHRNERTVFRLTLVKQFNVTEQQCEISDYAQLIEQGEPDFVEIKAVTFCGTVHDNAITMQNVPWHEEVVKFSEALVKASEFTRDYYDIACEHRHSCCVLIAKKKFRIDGKWHTWIDYDKFHELAMSGRPFDGLEYSQVTPDWALFGSKEEGFDPVDTRVYTKGRKKLPGPPDREGTAKVG